MILVTGGTGLVGSHLLIELASRNKKLKAIMRSSSDLTKLRKVFGYYAERSEADDLFKRIEWITADINDIPSLNTTFENVSEVYHCAALVSFDPSDEKKLRKINIEGTANIVNLCIANRVKKLCYVSSVAAIGSSSRNGGLDETAKWNPEENHNDYAISKYGAEIEVWRGTQEGVDSVIVNPGVIIGPGFWNSGTGKIFSKIDKGLKYHFPKVTGFVGVKDVVKSIIQLMDSDVRNEQFILVSENISFEKILRISAEAMDKPAPKKQLTKSMVFLGWIFQKIGSLFGAKRQITRESIQGLFTETQFNSSKVKSELNFEFTPMKNVLEETVKIYNSEKN
ncbi:NAD-dependent epimerase/dehydratase family protein [Christiangramia sp. SM2212]|uniref:SDR family oxidoreductase n=1 Tax=Christiangramia sediminicola TaxID=3073267 RepID=A0ABU1EMJ7_9FLAO|nr:NAD-dependent epimerase/dehydratase family protein [Christiangramia sp. SM2212]MDR5589292.1 SDR family oxidoreductase [Christiangramia sp. SM2212]